MNKEQMRFEAAKAAMQSIVLNSRWDKCHWDVIAEASVHAADCLIEALARRPSTEHSSVVPDDDGWIMHKPGDPMPCDPDLMVVVRFIDGEEDKWKHAGFWKGADGEVSFWDECGEETIIAWKPSKLTGLEILHRFSKS